MAGWKAIILQLEDQMAAGVAKPVMAAAHAAGIVGFAERVLKTPYAITPLRPSHWRPHNDGKEGKEEVAAPGMRGGLALDLLQRFENSVVHLRGVWMFVPPMQGTSHCRGGLAPWKTTLYIWMRTSRP